MLDELEPSHCVNKTKNKIIVLKEKKRAAVLKNTVQDQYFVCKFDQCIVCNEIAADFVVQREVCGRILIVELKGGDVNHAMEQLISTAERLKNRFGLNKPFTGLVVCSQVPSADTRWQLRAREFSKKFRGRTHPRCGSRFEFAFDEFVSS